MSYTSKRWVGLGLTAALLSTTALASCGGEGSESNQTGDTDHSAAAHGEAAAGMAIVSGEAGESGEGEGGESGHADMGALPVSHRVAFMAGHVEAGMALLMVGEPQQAAKHLLHPVSETHASEREGLDALGFTPDVFERLSAAAKSGQGLDELASDAAMARENIALLRANAGGDTKDTVAFLMDTIAEEYQAGVKNGEIINAGEYQDAYGFAMVALQMVTETKNDAYGPVALELVNLASLWPNDAPLASDTPASVAEILAQVSRVRLELSDIE